MLGLAHHNIAVISVVLDRKNLCSHTIVRSEPDWPQHLQTFLTGSVSKDRKRVIMVDDVAFLQRLKREMDGISKNSPVSASAVSDSVVLLFDTPDNLLKIKDLRILDAEKKNDSWVLHKVVPSQLNTTLLSASGGLPATVTVPPVQVTNVVVAKPPVEESASAFDPAKGLFFQKVEDFLGPLQDDNQRDQIRQLLAAWYEGSFSEDYEKKIHERMKKLGMDVKAYVAWEASARDSGYLDGLRNAAEFLANNQDKTFKEVAKDYGVRVGDLKWMNTNWDFSNLLSVEDENSDSEITEDSDSDSYSEDIEDSDD